MKHSFDSSSWDELCSKYSFDLWRLIWLFSTISLISTKRFTMMTNGWLPKTPWSTDLLERLLRPPCYFSRTFINVINLYIGGSHTNKENLVHKYIFLYSPRWPRRTGHFPIKRSTVNLKNAVCNKYKVRWRFNIYLENKSIIDIKVKRYVMRCCWKPINTHITGKYIIGD